jgi:hypothetical protein
MSQAENESSADLFCRSAPRLLVNETRTPPPRPDRADVGGKIQKLKSETGRQLLLFVDVRCCSARQHIRFEQMMMREPTTPA